MAYIDRDKFYKDMLTRFGCVPMLTDHSSSLNHDILLDEALNMQPTADVVEVVRCKDCRFYKVGNPNADYCYHKRHEHHGQGTSYKPDDFCSYGERTPQKEG